MQLPAPVRPIVAEHLRLLDEAHPGLVRALHLTGSVALGEYRPGVSDIDMVCVLTGAVDPPTLASVHARLPRYDGIYLDEAAWAAQPDDGRPITFVVNGELRIDQPCGELNPVLWLTLGRYPVTVRGEDPVVRVDPERLRRWNLTNLAQYWRPLAAQVRSVIPHLPADQPIDTGGLVDADGVVWTVLGPPRLHATLATGHVIGKSAAGRYAAGRFPAWADLLARAVQRREHQVGTFTVDDVVAAADLVDAVVDDAEARFGAVSGG